MLKEKWKIGALVFNYVISSNLSYLTRYLLESDDFTKGIGKRVLYQLMKGVVAPQTYISMFKEIDMYTLFGWFFMIVITIFLTNPRRLKRTSHKVSDSGLHGKTRWQTPAEIRQNYYKDQLGWFLGSSLNKGETYRLGVQGNYLPFASTVHNSQVLVIAPPKGWKSTTIVIPNHLHLPYIYKRNGKPLPDVFGTDTKLEVYKHTYNNYLNEGYNVVALDFINFKIEGSLNILDTLDESDELGMQILANAYIWSLEGEEVKDPFFPGQEEQALAAMIGFIKQVNPPEEQHLPAIGDFIRENVNLDDLDALENLFDHYFVEGAALKLWKNFLLICESTKVASNILGGLANKLKLFALKDIESMTSKSSFNLKQFGRKVVSEEEARKQREELKAAISIIMEKYEEQSVVENELLKKKTLLEIDLKMESDELRGFKASYDELKSKYVMLQKGVESGSLQITVEDLDRKFDAVKEMETLVKKTQNKIQSLKRKVDGADYELRKQQSICRKILNKAHKAKMEMESIKTKPIALYMLLPDSHKAFQPISAMMISAYFRVLVTNSYNDDLKLEVDVCNIFEEAMNIGVIPDWAEVLSTIRSRGAHTLDILQNYPQLMKNYPKSHEIIYSNHDTKLFLGFGDMTTAQKCSESMGEYTAEQQNMSVNAIDTKGHDAQFGYSEVGVKLYAPADLMQSENETMYIVQRSALPAKAYKTQYHFWDEKQRICDPVKIDFSKGNMAENIVNDVYSIIGFDDSRRELRGVENEHTKDAANGKQVERSNHEMKKADYEPLESNNVDGNSNMEKDVIGYSDNRIEEKEVIMGSDNVQNSRIRSINRIKNQRARENGIER